MGTDARRAAPACVGSARSTLKGSAIVIIVGAGFAGLSAAVRLADAGVRVHVIEARPTPGGRANAFRDPATGEHIDNGQHVLAGCYDETLAFLTRIGTIAKLHRPSTLRLTMIDERGWRSDLVFPPLPTPLNLLAGILAWDALSVSDRWAILRIGDALRSAHSVVPGETVRQWLRRHHQTARLCHIFWEPLALAALNQSIDQATAEMFVAVTSRLFGGTPDAASILVPSVPLDELYVKPSLRFLEERQCVVTTHAKAQIVIDGTGELSSVKIGDDHLHPTAVICAVPWYAMGDVFVGAPPRLDTLIVRATSLGSAPIVTVNLWLEKWRSPEPMVGLPGRTFQWLFDRSALVGAHQRHVSLISSGADAICARPNDELVAMAWGELRATFPELRDTRLQHTNVIRERRATFSLQAGSPQRPGVRTPLKGLFLAGDWTDTGLPATIEGAVVSGHLAAAAALQCLQ